MAVITRRKYPFLWRLMRKDRLSDSVLSSLDPNAKMVVEQELLQGLDNTYICLASSRFMDDALGVFDSYKKLIENIHLIKDGRFVVLFRGILTVVTIDSGKVGALLVFEDELCTAAVINKNSLYQTFDDTLPNTSPLSTGMLHILSAISLILFSQMSKIDKAILPPKTTIKQHHCKYKNDLPFPVQNWSLNWYTQSVQSNPFVVRSHWRMQACGKNFKERKLIPIEAHMKSGYTKGAYMND